MTTTIIVIVSSLLAFLCAGAGFVLFLLFVIGFVLLRRRGKKVTAKEAVAVGAERVSQVFMRTKDGGLQPVQADDQEDDA
ncbi:MAG: hypothetical protein ABMA64_07850 [Myxococcota bacterium]